MRRNIKHILWAAALLLTACTQEELPLVTDGGDAQTITITVTDGGYSSEGQQTRAVENGYRTEFTAGDECGLYIVRGGIVVYDNVKLTATAGVNGSLTWQNEADVTLTGGFPDESWFLYYPYQADMSGKTFVSATDAEGFFAPLVSGWQPKADQSIFAAYTASDLMTAKGTAAKDGGSLKLTFSMTHRMALAVIEMPQTVYKFTNPTGGAIPDYTVPATADFTVSSVKPYCISSGTYRCIENPASSTATSITGSYDGGKKEFTVTSKGLVAGSYKTYKIDGAAAIVKSYTLQPGDYFCKDGSGNWYVIPGAENPGSECIGIVFYAGHHPNDASDYSGTGIRQKHCHGYAVALQDATSGYCMWGVYGKELGCCRTDADGNKQSSYANPDIDWCGYDWTQKIITAAGGKGNLNATEQAGYPATWYAVVSYETVCNAPSNSSGWFLPSFGQMWKIYQHRSTLFAFKSVATGLQSDWYWSSSESYGDPAHVAMSLLEDGRASGKVKSNSYCYVRPVLAF